jgi:hypothetical protein
MMKDTKNYILFGEEGEKTFYKHVNIFDIFTNM